MKKRAKPEIHTRGEIEIAARRLRAAWNAVAGISTADLERLSDVEGDAARLAQLANAADAAYQRAKEPK